MTRTRGREAVAAASAGIKRNRIISLRMEWSQFKKKLKEDFTVQRTGRRLSGTTSFYVADFKTFLDFYWFLWASIWLRVRKARGQDVYSLEQRIGTKNRPFETLNKWPLSLPPFRWHALRPQLRDLFIVKMSSLAAEEPVNVGHSRNCLSWTTCLAGSRDDNICQGWFNFSLR